MNYRDTLNLPGTSFPMKASLVRREPQMQKRWDEMDLYGRIRKLRAGARKFILHDGPPYANGDVHIGTGLNKILKDVVVKFKTMRGFDAPFIPGWDCHGLPIEHRVCQELGESVDEMSPRQIRARCRRYAEKFIKLQRRQFRSLGVLGQWAEPYLTMSREYETGIIEVLADMVAAGAVYRKLKPIHWCTETRTALAEAELEYHEIASPSVWVKFRVVEGADGFYRNLGDEKVFLIIWTTTPWTLPANMAIAVHPRIDYAAVRVGDEVWVLAAELVEQTMETVGAKSHEIIEIIPGAAIEHVQYRHPFMNRTSPVVLADYVSIHEGTGCVHTAPGHGREDYLTGLKYGLEILSPVDERGFMTEDAGPFAGMHVPEVDDEIIAHLERIGALVARSRITHSYPHCWRSKKPVIFRATEQWFVDVDNLELRSRSLEEVEKVKWIPRWGRVRIAGMLRERPDWCISRQRYWGVPIPALYCETCTAAVLEENFLRHVIALFRREGADAWFSKPPEELIPKGTVCPQCGSGKLRKENDILDVWFESGASHHCVCETHEDLAFPADLYLEGSDQHRGWFQSSLLTSVATRRRAPYRTVLTHGFVVDEQGRKMSKSLGNLINAEEAVKTVGADVLRLWISSVDYREDINVSMDIFKRMAEPYRKIRNTLRFLLANLGDFDPSRDALGAGQLRELDRWALDALGRLVVAVTAAYEEYEFHRVFTQIHNFCAVTMSAFYLDVQKDVLYCEAADSRLRRSAQTAIFKIADALVRLVAPVLVHTAEEAWLALPPPRGAESVHLADWPTIADADLDDALRARWDRFGVIRGDVNRQIEKLREAKKVSTSMEVSVTLSGSPEIVEFLRSFGTEELARLLMVSELEIADEPPARSVQGMDEPELAALVAASIHRKCARCWNLRPTVGSVEGFEDVCGRCADVLKAKGNAR